MSRLSVAVVGAGISGLATAHRLVQPVEPGEAPEVTLFDGGPNPGGRLRASPFAGVPAVDEGADAMLARVPDAIALAREVGLGDDLVHPEPVSAAVWMGGVLHPIPEGLVLGVPRHLRPLVGTRLLTWRGKLRAAVEPLLPRSDPGHDSIGELIRARFGDEVHDRIVDALVGSIYAADTDRSSLAEVPQLAALASSRSLLLAARGASSPGTATAGAAPVFASPRGGTAALSAATRRSVVDGGADVRNGTVDTVETDGVGWRVDGEPFDAVVLATSAQAASRLLASSAPDAARRLGGAETADVAMVTLHVSDGQWSEQLVGRSGYLVPKSVQRTVTAVSFGSQKWAHWRPPHGGEIIRVSLGRDGLPILDRTDEEILEATLTDLEMHLGVAFTPIESRVTRWPGAFPQYRPHHRRWVDEVTGALPRGLELAGAAYRGIGIPACIRDGRRAADAVLSSPAARG